MGKVQKFCKGGGQTRGILKRGGHSCKQHLGSTGRRCLKISFGNFRGDTPLNTPKYGRYGIAVS